MNTTALLATLCLVSSNAFAALPDSVTCYNDDSQDLVNQDELRVDPVRGIGRVPEPADCLSGQAVAVSDGKVWVNGNLVFDGRIDGAMEARVSPVGTTTIFTRDGSVFLHDADGLRAWYRNDRFRPATQFKMARDGTLIGATADELLLASDSGKAAVVSGRVSKLTASVTGRTVALMTDGRIVEPYGTVYDRTTDPALELKVTATDGLFWRTERGKIMTSDGAGSPARVIYDRTTTPAISFKVNAGGCVAFLDSDGMLWKGCDQLTRSTTPVVSYRILNSGAVVGVDTNGKPVYFP